MNHTKFYLTLLTGFLLGAATLGCHSSSSAADDDSSYATVTQLTAMQTTVTALQAQVTQLQAALPKGVLSGAVTTSAASRSVFGRFTEAASASTTAQAVGTISPGALTATGADILSSQSYVFHLPLGIPGNVGIGGIYPIFFDDGACQGNPYIQQGPSLSQFAVNQGVVLSPSNGSAVDYLYLPRGEALSNVTIGSEIINASGTCTPETAFSTSAYLLKTNDPTTTGVQNSLISNIGVN